MSTQSNPVPDHFIISITLDTDSGSEPTVSTFVLTDRLTYETFLRRASVIARSHAGMKVEGYPAYAANEVRALADFLSDIDEGVYTLSGDADFDDVIPA